MANEALAVATFGAGCFWGVQARFDKLPGVKRTTVGYCGGESANTHYREVCSGNTGHAEVVQVEYNPDEIQYDDLLAFFWDNHNPTTLNQQGPDHGTQYRSVVFYHDDRQKKAAEEYLQKLQSGGKFTKPIVTTIEPYHNFCQAEEYHQKYFEKNGGSCGI